MSFILMFMFDYFELMNPLIIFEPSKLVPIGQKLNSLLSAGGIVLGRANLSMLKNYEF
jgi:hypothetical protein